MSVQTSSISTYKNLQEVVKGFVGSEHAFTFKNDTGRIIKVLLEEDPESELQEHVANAGLKAGVNAMGIFEFGAKADVGRIRKGARPNQDFILYPEDETEKSMKSKCILYTAAFVDGDVYKIFKTQVTVHAGTVLTFSAKHELPEQIKAEVRAPNIEQALQKYISRQMSQQMHRPPTQHNHLPLPPHFATLASAGVPSGFVPISGPVMVHSSQQGWVLADCKGLAIASQQHPSGSVLVVYRGQPNQKTLLPGQLASTLMPVV
jgi:hypothetical protein